MQVGPEPDPTRDYTQHHHISLGGTREGPWAAQEASPLPRRWSDSSWVPNREEYFLRLEIILGPNTEKMSILLNVSIYTVAQQSRAHNIDSRAVGYCQSCWSV